ncbi:hypothetical protein SAMN05192534_11527 [Alteribacillus persepolensis]|uniref:Permease family protein n=1 Tax=Alteribacillus persepolensis TaxID=568899 RepID=A0A1G8GCI7_9BACI|nr:hypothetical protein [Alteribacillus persepolensis]SDH92073.1 hypothetical protein SAMN05192534_11527 [Alteribacillus persepolensis]
MQRQRPYGGIQPGIKWGPFTLRLPGAHINLTPSQHIQGGFLLLATCGSVTPLMMQYFDVSFEIAWTVSLVMLFWVLAQTFLFGDVYAAGAITSGLPLTIVFMNAFTPGTEAIQAMIAVTLIVAFLFFFFGITKLGEKFNRLVPNSLKAGVIMGAAIAAFQSELDRLPEMPFSLITAWIIVLILMFSIPFSKLPNNKVKLSATANALLVALAGGAVAGLISGEVSFDISWGFFVPPIGETVASLSLWSVGLPSWDIFMAAIPISLMIYVLAFGDLLVANTLLKEANHAREDETIDINSTRSHYTLALRNVAQLLTAGPLLWVHGPIWTGVQVFLLERYKKGRHVMESIFTGPFNFYLMAIPLGLLLPVIGLIMPLFPVALSVTLLLTGFACAYVAMSMVSNNTARGVVLIIGMLTAFQGPAWGMGIGIVLCLVLIGKREEQDHSPEQEKDDIEITEKTG